MGHFLLKDVLLELYQYDGKVTDVVKMKEDSSDHVENVSQ